MNPISLGLNLTTEQARGRSRVKGTKAYGRWWPIALGKVAGKTSHTQRGWLFISTFICFQEKKNPQFSVPSWEENLQIMMPCSSDLQIFSLFPSCFTCATKCYLRVSQSQRPML